MDMSISKKRPISQFEPFEKPCFVIVGLVDVTPSQLQLISTIKITKLVSIIEWPFHIYKSKSYKKMLV